MDMGFVCGLPIGGLGTPSPYMTLCGLISLAPALPNMTVNAGAARIIL